MDDAPNPHPDFDFDAVVTAVEDAPAELDSPDAELTPELDASPDDSTTPVDEAEPIAPEPPVIPWDHPDLVALRQQAELAQANQAEAEQMRYLRSVAQQSQALQAQRQLTNQIVELSDGDMDQHNKILGVIAQVTQPVVQQAQQHEARATGAEKMLSAYLLAAEAHLPPEQRAAVKATFDELMAVEGPQVMQKIAFAEQINAQKYNPIIQQQNQKIAELERRLTAAASVAGRRGSGVQAVDRGAPAMAGADSTDASSFFDNLWGQ